MLKHADTWNGNPTGIAAFMPWNIILSSKIKSISGDKASRKGRGDTQRAKTVIIQTRISSPKQINGGV